MLNEKGNLSINSENILPIIKKWLYSDSDIFVREMVSNAADAITKLKKLVDMGEAEHIPADETYAVHVAVDKEKKIITVEDNGIGMTAEEVREYINQIAFSGASDFLEKFKDKVDSSNDIIGHFGLGFYSAFMVADKVQIDTLSYREGAEAASWLSDGGIEYEMGGSDRAVRGTTITLYIGEDGKDFLDEYKLRSVLKKYCGFIPVEIYFEAIKTEDEKEKKAREKEEKKEAKKAAKEAAREAKKEKAEKTEEESVVDMSEDDGLPEDWEDDGEPIDVEAEEVSKPQPINDTFPLWLKQPSECTDEEYKEFYHKVFSDFSDPLFWIHLNMDYPFRLKGILYFPRLKHELESIEGQVKLYNNQVFIADNIKEVIPEFLLLLKGTIDCPDLPLNVSRSFLQNDGYVTKMSGYITKKVADKLNSVFKKDREDYNGYWDDISQFIKYGCIRERDFYDKVKGSILYKTIGGEYATLEEFKEKNKDKTKDKIFYVTNDRQQAQYIKMFKDNEMDAVVLTSNLDNPFISYLESYETSVHFCRIDSELSEVLTNEDESKKDKKANEKMNEELQAVFQAALDKKELKIRSENLKTDSVSAIILQSEQARRMEEMSKMFGGGMGMPNMYQNEETLVLNTNAGIVKSLIEMKDDESRKDDVNLICEHIYDLAMMSHKPLDTDSMTRFIERSNAILQRVAGM